VYTLRAVCLCTSACLYACSFDAPRSGLRLDASSPPHDDAAELGDAAPADDAAEDAGTVAALDAAPDGGEDAAALDVGEVAPCTAKWLAGVTFENVGEIAELASVGNERAPTLSFDELSVFFSSDRPGGSGAYDLWTAKRTGRELPFDAPINAGALGLNSTADDSRISLSRDGLTAYVSSTRSGGLGMGDVWIATRTAGDGMFIGMTPLLPVSSAHAELDAVVGWDGLELYIGGNGYPGGLGRTEILRASRPRDTDTFSTPMFVPALNSADSERGLTLSADGRIAVFNTNRGGGPSRLWSATRDRPSDPFSAPVEISALMSTESYADPFLSADGCTLYFARSRSMKWDLMRAEVAGLD
jgi:hypothetical protein